MCGDGATGSRQADSRTGPLGAPPKDVDARLEALEARHGAGGPEVAPKPPAVAEAMAGKEDTLLDLATEWAKWAGLPIEPIYDKTKRRYGPSLPPIIGYRPTEALSIDLVLKSLHRRGLRGKVCQLQGHSELYVLDVVGHDHRVWLAGTKAPLDQ